MGKGSESESESVENILCMHILCSHRVWHPNLSPNLNLSPAVEMSHNGHQDKKIGCDFKTDNQPAKCPLFK